MKYYITDVFSNGKYTGNQLASFILEKEIPTKLMQSIAQEVNYSETTFIDPLPMEDGSYKVRVFTPKSEINFAGHPTLGSAYIVKNIINPSLDLTINLNFKVGKIPVSIQEEVYWMKQVQPEFTVPMDPYLLAKMISVDNSEIDLAYPISGVTTGLPFTIIPLKSKTALKLARLDMNIYEDFIKNTWAKGVLVFCKGGYTKDQQIMSRVFVPYWGIIEDPATGSASGCLSAWMLKNNYLQTPSINFKIGQGYEINRPSEIYINASKLNDQYDLNVGGKVEFIAEGNWFL